MPEHGVLYMTVKMTMEEYEGLKAKKEFAEKLVDKIIDCARVDDKNNACGVDFGKFYWLYDSVRNYHA